MPGSKDIIDPREEPPGYVEAQLSGVLKDARGLYSQSSGKHEDIEEFMNPGIRSIDDLKAQIDASNSNFTNFRAKRAGLFSSLSAMLKPVELIGEVATGATAEIFPATQSIFSAVMFLVNAANNVSATYDSIQQLFDQLQDFTSRLDVYVQDEMPPSLRKKVVEILAALFEVFVIAAKQVRRGRVKSYFRNLFGVDSPVAEALQDLERLTQGEERQVMAHTYGAVRTIDTTTKRVERLVKQVDQNMQEFRQEYRERTSVAHQDKLREILEPSPFPEDFYTSFDKCRVDGTGDWLLEDTDLKAWMRGDTKYLWLSGGPGVGKSFLATRLITWANDELKHSAYFYFRANNPETRSVLQALRDVAYQLSESDAFYGRQVVDKAKSADNIKTIASAFRELFVNPFAEDTRGRLLHVFLDGIDEAETSEIEDLLSQFTFESKSPPQGRSRVLFALVGRSYMSDIVSSYLDPPNTGESLTTVHVTPNRNANDVRAYIEEGVRNSRSLRRGGATLQRQVIELMEKRVDGLFIVAKFMLADVDRGRRANTILKSLETYPKEINGVLNTTLTDLSATITEEEAEDLNEMLRWTACAEQALTLEQLEAILIMEFVAVPLRLEDSLRGQYACFFELEREDGLTTDDLFKDHYRERRDSTPSSSRPGARRVMSHDKKESPKRTSMSPGNRSPGPRRRRTSPLTLDTSYARPFSPSRSPARSDPEQELQILSKKSTTTVTFFHASVREYFRDVDTTTLTSRSGGHKIGIDITKARVHVLQRCMKMFNDPEWFKREDLGYRRFAIKQYAAWYWQEHLAAVDMSLVSTQDKQTIGNYVAGMLMDEDIIYDWSIMYMKNDEGLELLTDRNIKALRKWMSDPDVQAGLDEAKRAWAAEAVGAVGTPMGISQTIGRFYARAWLDESFDKYIPTQFCFKIVQNMAYMDAGFQWSESQCNWSQFSVAQRIKKATAWAGFEQTSHWYRRLGSTYLTSGMHEIALTKYEKALELDPGSVETNGRKAYCLSKNKECEAALTLALQCKETEEMMIREENLPPAKLEASKWRLYKDEYLIAQCYYRVDDVEKSIEHFHLAIASADAAKLDYNERFEPIIGLLEVLAAENKHAEIMRLIHSLSIKAKSTKEQASRIIDFLLGEHKTAMVMDWIPKAACKADEAAFLLGRLELAIDVAKEKRDALKELYLRLAMGTTLIYDRQSEKAIDVFEQISLVEYRPRGNVPTRQAHAISFQKLASLYKGEVLRAGVTNPTADPWIDALEKVQARQAAHQNLDMPASMLGSDVNAAAIYLALFYRIRGRKEEAERLLSALIVESCEILEDEDLKNDEFALENLLRLFIAADDEANAKALATSMRRINPEASISTPGDSPVQQRAQPEPKLPDIQSSNRSCAQCLEIIPANIEFFMCRYCLDSYCRRCLKNIIEPGKEESICRKDHEWFGVPPLGENLHTGWILIEGKQIKFHDWKDGIRKRWRKN